MKPMVAVVGRPNVGKSTFFNKVCKDRISIVKDIPGVTRDRVLADAEWCGKEFTLIDTGGLEPFSQDPFQPHIRKQAEIAIEMADVILFFVDGREGIVASDYEVANILRQANKPVLLAVNKLDNFDPSFTYEFYQLGIGDPIGISSEAGLGLGDLLDEVVKFFPEFEDVDYGEAIKIAVVGKPNAGKSSLVNKILGEERVIVSDIAGTTRDTIDTPVTLNGQNYILIDTAGLRRKRSVEDNSIESISAIRAIKAIERADAVLIMLDALEPVSEQDVRVAGYVHEHGKPSVIVINKWDLVVKDTYTMNKYKNDLSEKLKFMDYFMPVFISAKTGQRVDKLLETAQICFDNSRKRIPTGVLNEIISEAVSSVEPPVSNGRRLKIHYTTQAEGSPPTFIFFVNDSELVHFSYSRYLENSLRKAMDFSGVPIRLEFRDSKEDK